MLPEQSFHFDRLRTQPNSQLLSGENDSISFSFYILQMQVVILLALVFFQLGSELLMLSEPGAEFLG